MVRIQIQKPVRRPVARPIDQRSPSGRVLAN